MPFDASAFGTLLASFFGDTGMKSDAAGTTAAATGDFVRKWLDQSGNANHAVYSGDLLPDTSNLPVAAVDGSGRKFLNGAGSSFGMLQTALDLSGLPVTVVVVGKTAAGKWFWSAGTPVGISADGYWVDSSFGIASITGFDPSTIQTVDTFIPTNKQSVVRINGTTGLAFTSPTAGSAAAGLFYIGCDYNQNHAGGAQIYAALVYQGDLTDRAGLETALTAYMVPPLQAPSGLTSIRSSTTQIDLSWTDNHVTGDPETGLVVEWADNAAFTSKSTHSLTVGTTSYSITGLTAATRYWVRVGSTDGSSTLYSNVVAPPVWFANVAFPIFEDFNFPGDFSTATDATTPTSIMGANGHTATTSGTPWATVDSGLKALVFSLSSTLQLDAAFDSAWNSAFTAVVLFHQPSRDSQSSNIIGVGSALTLASDLTGQIISCAGISSARATNDPQATINPLGQIDVAHVTSDGTTMRWGLNGQTTDAACSALGISSSNFKIASTDANVFRIILIKDILTQTDLENVVKAILPVGYPQLLNEGDSLTAVTDANDAIFKTHLQVAMDTTYTGTKAVIAGLLNAAQGGAVIDQATQDALGFSGGNLAARAADFIDNRYDQTRRQLLQIMIGTNDGNLLDPTTSFNALLAYCTARKAACPNLDIIIYTIPPRGDGTFLTTFNSAFRTPYHNLLRVASNPPWIYLVDWSADTDIGVDGANTNTTFYESGSNPTHFNATGYALFASRYQVPTIQAWLDGSLIFPAFKSTGFFAW